MSDETDQQKKLDALAVKPSKDRLAEIITESNRLIDQSRSATDGWDKKRVKALERRRGLIGKQRKDVPFRDSSDYRFRLEEMVLRQLNPAFTMALRMAPKLARYVPLDPQFASKADDLEWYTQYQLIGEDQQFHRNMKLLANKRNECVAVAKIIWEHRTQPRSKVFTRAEFAEKLAPFEQRKAIVLQSLQVPVTPDKLKLDKSNLKAAIAEMFGWDLKRELYDKRADKAADQWQDKEAEVIRIIVDETVVNRPSIIPITDLSNFRIPENAASIQDAEWIAHDRDYSEIELLQSRDRFENVDKLLDAVKSAVRYADTTQYQLVLERAAGLTSTGQLQGHITVRELYRYIPRKDIAAFNGLTDDDDTPVKAVLNYCPDVPPELVPPLRCIEFPYEYSTPGINWPFEEDTFNLTEDRFYTAEGAGMLIEPYARQYDQWWNAANDRDTITLSPPTLVFKQAGISGTAFRQVGQVMQVNMPVGEGVIHIPQFPDLSSKLQITAEHVRGYAEQIVGLGAMANLPHYDQPPTAEQVQQLNSPSQQIQADQIADWVDFVGRILRHVHDLNAQFLFPMKQGEGNATVPKLSGQAGETVTITPDHFKGKYMIFCGADFSRSNPMFEAQKFVAWYQLIFKDPTNAPYVNPYDTIQLATSKLIGHIDSQVVMQPREKAEQLNQQWLQMQAMIKATIEEKKQKSATKGKGGGLKELTGAHGGIFPKSIGTG